EPVLAEVINLSNNAVRQFTVEKDIAKAIKQGLDLKFGGPWHVIVGKEFGSFVTHESGYFVYFMLESKAFLVFKTAS
ncbi:hypothetical protein CANCADRAFT_28610, partial [Tortispora caseinolytica NRRL Y-17796]